MNDLIDPERASSPAPSCDSIRVSIRLFCEAVARAELYWWRRGEYDANKATILARHERLKKARRRK